jgi:hypothetical protein
LYTYTHRAQLFASLLDTHFKAQIKKFVGKDGTEYMTKNRFLGLMSPPRHIHPYIHPSDTPDPTPRVARER